MSSAHQPIWIDDDSDDDTIMGDSDVQLPNGNQYRNTIHHTISAVNELIEQYEDTQLYTRNEESGLTILGMGCVPIPHFRTTTGQILRPGMAIEYKPDREKYALDYEHSNPREEDYFLIREILRRPNRSIILEGFLLRSEDHCNGHHDDRCTELSIIIKVSDPSRRDATLHQSKSWIELPREGSYRIREVILTNKTPRHINNPDLTGRTGPLYCRWVHMIKWNKVGSKVVERVVRRVRADECQPEHRMSNEQQRMDWLGHEMSAHTLPTSGLVKLYMDIFSGAGGWILGAQQAGVQCSHAVEKDPIAAQTLRYNFPACEVHHVDVSDFIQSWSGRRYPVRPPLRCIILTISPPCQMFSPAKRSEGKNDDANIAANYCIEAVLQTFRPRIVLMEQTFGLTFLKDHVHHFAMIRQQFTSQGYSIRCRVEDFRHYGVPQMRQRVIIIATAPGEPLYAHPETTHGGLGQPPIQYAQDVLNEAARLERRGSIRPDMLSVRKLRTPMPRYDARNKLLYTICTAPRDEHLYHPNGKEAFSLLQLAVAQGLGGHRFAGTRKEYIHKQVGNAVPAQYSKALHHHIMQCIKKEDARTFSRRAARTIVID